MKQLLLVTALFGFFALSSTQGQSCLYSKAAENQASCHAKASEAAAKAASLDASIEERACPQSGKVSYVRKNVCAASGKVSYESVEYCTKSGRFINVSTQEKSCTKSKAACSKGAKATKVSNTGAVECTPAQRAACLKACSKTKATQSASNGDSRVKLASYEQ